MIVIFLNYQAIIISETRHRKEKDNNSPAGKEEFREPNGRVTGQ